MHAKTLYLHSSGPQVRALQLLLRPYDSALAVDGRFGPITERAVRAAQRKLGVFPIDGMAGPFTLTALTKAARTDKPARPTPPPTSAHVASVGQRLGGLAHQAGAAVASAEHAVVTTVEEAIAAVEKWIAGLSPHPTPVPPSLHPVVQPGQEKAKHTPNPLDTVQDPRGMHMSPLGLEFVFWCEAGDGSKTGRLHHPHGNSGVTLGPGYDMKERTPEAIKRDLMDIDGDPAAAAVAAQGSRLKREQADAFVKSHHSLLNLSLKQQVQLQLRYKEEYEAKVQHAIHIPLHQYEFDALVSFAGNDGTMHHWKTTVRLVNEHKPHEAMAEVATVIHTGDPKLTPGLINRRRYEANLFLFGDYNAGRRHH